MNREQDRAAKAYEHVKNVDQNDKAIYATVVYQTINLMMSAGLTQALETMSSLRNKQKTKAVGLFFDQLAEQMRRINPNLDKGDSLREYAREPENFQDYILLSREMLATLIWYRRFVQSVLKISSDGAQDNQESCRCPQSEKV